MTSPTEVRPAADAVAVAVLRRHLEGLRRVVLAAELALHDLGEQPAEPDPLDAMLRASPRLARELRDKVLGKVLALPREDRDLLFEALEAWVAADGDAYLAGQIAFCHRNTVFSRLHKIARLAGVNLVGGGLADRTRMVMAVRAHRMLEGAR